MFLGMKNNESNNVKQMKTVEAVEAIVSRVAAINSAETMYWSHLKALGLFCNHLNSYPWYDCGKSSTYNLFMNPGLFK